MTSYSDEEVKRELLDWRDVKDLKEHFSLTVTGKDLDILVWAAEQYLKAKPVIEWYADRENYERTWDESGDPGWINVVGDNGQRAREFLNGR